MTSSVHPRLLANQLVLNELLRQRRQVPARYPDYTDALNTALADCDELAIDDVVKAEVRALIVRMRPAHHAG